MGEGCVGSEDILVCVCGFWGNSVAPEQGEEWCCWGGALVSAGGNPAVTVMAVMPDLGKMQPRSQMWPAERFLLARKDIVGKTIKNWKRQSVAFFLPSNAYQTFILKGVSDVFIGNDN